MLRMLRVACIVCLVVGSACAQPAPAPIPETHDQFDFTSPAQAMAALRARPDVTFTEQRGWTVAADRANLAVWSFVPQGHPAYPAVVRRRAFQRNGEWFTVTQVLCGATKPACDALMREFQQLDQAMRQSLQSVHR